MPTDRSWESWFHALVSGQARGPKAVLQRAGLRLLSWPAALGIWTRNQLYNRRWRQIHQALIPVISVGNLTMGGTGKTPCVEWVAGYLSEQGHRVAVLSRGYGQQQGPNDEALVLEENLPDVPHLQGADRVALAQLAIEELESEILVLDDGFQHRRLARSLDLVLVDATNPWGHGNLFPRGLLREPLSSLRRADAVILTRTDLVDPASLKAIRQRIERVAPGVPIFESIHAPRCLVNAEAQTKSIAEIPRISAAFCGLGNPEAFRETLRRLDREPTSWRTFPDHHSYTRQDVEELERWGEEAPGDGIVLTTQKDLVKLRLATLGGRPLWALRVGLELTVGGDQLRQMLDRVAI